VNLLRWSSSSVWCCIALLLSLSAVGQAKSQSGNSAAADEKNSRLLEPGKPVEQKLKGGESHVYHIHLDSGQFLRVLLEERGIDLVLVLVGPENKTIVEADSLNYRWGRQPASMIADSSGTYQMRVESRDANQPLGSYAVAVTDRRAPKPEDQTRIAAERTLFKAKQLAGKLGTHSNAADAREAIALYEKALALWREVDDPYEQALALYSAAFLYDRLGEKHKALHLYNKALPLCHANGDQVGEATTLNNLGIAYAGLGEYQSALDSFQKVLPFEQALGARNEEATTLGNIAVIYDRLGEKQKALNTYKQVLPVKRAMGDRDGEAATLLSRGNLYGSLGEYPRALEYYQQTLELSRAIGNGLVEYVTINNMALAYSNLQETQKALDFYSQSLKLRRIAGDRAAEAVTLNNIGLLVFTAGDKQKAMEIFKQALTREREVGDRQGEATTLSNIGYLNTLLGDKKGALENITRALALARTLRNPLLEVEVETNLMMYWEKQSNASLAVFFGKQAINSIQQVRRNITGFEKEEQHSFLKSNEGVYRELADLLVSQGRLFEAQQILAMLKEEEYLKFTRSTRAGNPSASASLPLTKTEAGAQKRYLEVTGALAAMAQEFDKLSLEPNPDAGAGRAI